MGVFGEHAEKLWLSGLSIIPTSTKITVTKDGKKKSNFPCIKEWSKWCDQQVDPETLRSWLMLYHDQNIGLACGFNSIVGIDLDTNDPNIRDIFEELLPLGDNLCAKVGSKGITWFFKAVGDFRSAKFNFNDSFIDFEYGDILYKGRQSVIPPSIHPIVGNPYKVVGFPIEEIWANLDEIDTDCVLKIQSAVKDYVLKNRPLFEEFHSKGKKTSGRNNAIKDEILNLFRQNKNDQEILNSILEYDKSHHSPPLFSDKSEYKNDDETTNAAIFLASMRKTQKKFNKNKFEDAVRTGFFTSVEKLNEKNGEVKVKKIPEFQLMARYFKEHLNLRTTDSYSKLWNGTHFTTMQVKELKQKIVELSFEQADRPAYVNQFYDQIINWCFSKEQKESQVGFFNLKNGIIDIKKRTLMPHSPTFGFEYCANVAFDQNAKCPLWINALKDIFENNQALIDVLAEIFGYTLAGGSPWLHKAFFFYGDGRNGKSTILEVLKGLLGSENISSISIDKLDKPFSVSTALNKLANIVGEITAGDVKSEAFKAAVGGDLIQAAFKGKDEFMMEFQARMIFSGNKLPYLQDTTAGAYERLYIIPFNRFYHETERQPDYFKELLAELPGILNWALDGYERLLARKRLPEIDAVKDALKEYRLESNHIYDWLDEHFEYGFSENQNDWKVIKIGDFYGEYELWAQKNGLHKVERRKFSKRVAQEIRRAGVKMEMLSCRRKFVAKGKFKIKEEFLKDLTHCMAITDINTKN